MAKQNPSKINRLDTLLDEGLLAPTYWLEEHGYSRANLAGYVDGGKLESPARGVYRRPGPPLKWQHVVASLQLLAGGYWHVGGRTALVQHGFGHYVRMQGPEPVYLYGPETLPHWVNRLGLKETFVARHDAMLGSLRARRSEHGTAVDFKDRSLTAARLAELGLREEPWGAWSWKLWFSADERAMLEFLQDAPAQASIHDADLFMQGLVSLRPALVSKLLQACASVKVKRLFLALAERHGHAWVNRLDLRGVDLGKGKRMLVRGGRLHAKYQITLPADLDDHAG